MITILNDPILLHILALMPSHYFTLSLTYIAQMKILKYGSNPIFGKNGFQGKIDKNFEEKAKVQTYIKFENLFRLI